MIHANRNPTASSPEPFVVSLHSLNLSVLVITNGVTTQKPGFGELGEHRSYGGYLIHGELPE